MVRIGIGMIGISPTPEIKEQLQNAVTFKTVISNFEVKKEILLATAEDIKQKKIPELPLYQ